MKTRIFPFWCNFYDALKFYIWTKFSKKQPTSSAELSPAAVLGPLKRRTSPRKASIMLLDCLFQLPLPGAFVPSVAKSWKLHLDDYQTERHSPLVAGPDTLLEQPWLWTWSWSPDTTISHQVAVLTQLLTSLHFTRLFDPNTQTGLSMHVSPVPPAPGHP